MFGFESTQGGFSHSNEWKSMVLAHCMNPNSAIDFVNILAYVRTLVLIALWLFYLESIWAIMSKIWNVQICFCLLVIVHVLFLCQFGNRDLCFESITFSKYSCIKLNDYVNYSEL